MPRYSVTGRIFAGVGGTAVSIDRVIVATTAGGAEADGDWCVYAKKIGSPDTWGLCKHNGTTEIALDDRGATVLRAGGGVWAATIGDSGIRSNIHPPIVSAGLHAVGPDGTLAFCPDYHDGRGLHLRNTAGVVTVLVPPTVAVRDVQLHGGQAATWIANGRIQSVYGAPTTPEGDCGAPRVVVSQGQRLLCYYHRDEQGERLLLQTEWSRPVGYVLLEAGPNALRAFRHDLTAVGGLRVCYATSEGEAVSSLREIRIDSSTPVVDLRRSSVPVPVPTPPPVIPKPEPKPVALPNHAEYVKKRCAELGLRQIKRDTTDATHQATKEHSFRIVNQIASELNAIDPGFGLLEKTSGNRVQDRAVDILTWMERSGVCHHFDVIGDAEGADGDPTPSWGYVGLINAARWREPYPVATVPTPTPPTPPTVPQPPTLPPLPPVPPVCEFAPCDHSEVNKRLAKIENALIALLAESRKPRPVTLSARYLGPITGEIGAPKA